LSWRERVLLPNLQALVPCPFSRPLFLERHQFSLRWFMPIARDIGNLT
jgi:hypothetical protein